MHMHRFFRQFFACHTGRNSVLILYCNSCPAVFYRTKLSCCEFTHYHFSFSGSG